VLRAILHQYPRLTTTEYPDVPSKIDRVLRRALAKAPNQRHATMALFAAELSALATDTPIEHLRRSFDDSTRISTTERRRAAVLVTVVSNYLALVEHMSPSEAHRLIARVRDLAVDVSTAASSTRRSERKSSRCSASRPHTKTMICAQFAPRSSYTRAFGPSKNPVAVLTSNCGSSPAFTSVPWSRAACTKDRDATTSSARQLRWRADSRRWRRQTRCG
jgi:hypothetical protein